MLTPFLPTDKSVQKNMETSLENPYSLAVNKPGSGVIL